MSNAGWTRDYFMLRAGSIIEYRDIPGTFKVAHVVRRGGAGVGMGEIPPSMSVIFEDSEWVYYDTWVPASHYREFRVVGQDTEMRSKKAVAYLQDT